MTVNLISAQESKSGIGKLHVGCPQCKHDSRVVMNAKLSRALCLMPPCHPVQQASCRACHSTCTRRQGRLCIVAAGAGAAEKGDGRGGAGEGRGADAAGAAERGAGGAAREAAPAGVYHLPRERRLPVRAAHPCSLTGSCTSQRLVHLRLALCAAASSWACPICLELLFSPSEQERCAVTWRG